MIQAPGVLIAGDMNNINADLQNCQKNYIMSTTNQ
jgi:hypothetical protein